MNGVGGGLGWSLLPPLMPDVAKELSISHAMGGLVWGAAALGIGVASPFGGWAVDRFGPRKVAGFAMLFGAATCAARALAFGPWTLAFAMLLFGLHIGFVAPAVPKALAGHVPAASLGRANGLAVLAYTL
jgi:MFS family permease